MAQTFGKFIAKKRSEKKVPTPDYANALGVSRSYVSYIERYKTKSLKPEQFKATIKSLNLTDAEAIQLFNKMPEGNGQYTLFQPSDFLSKKQLNLWNNKGTVTKDNTILPTPVMKTENVLEVKSDKIDPHHYIDEANIGWVIEILAMLNPKEEDWVKFATDLQEKYL